MFLTIGLYCIYFFSLNIQINSRSAFIRFWLIWITIIISTRCIWWLTDENFKTSSTILFYYTTGINTNVNKSFTKFSCCFTIPQKDNQPLVLLRNTTDLIRPLLIQFFYTAHYFIRTKLVSVQSIAETLACQTWFYALKDTAKATTHLIRVENMLENQLWNQTNLFFIWSQRSVVMFFSPLL